MELPQVPAQVQVTEPDQLHAELELLNAQLLDELTRRLDDIAHSYSAMAQQVGALYMRADESGLNTVTRALDRPLRDASNDRQTFDALRDAMHQVREDRQA